MLEIAGISQGWVLSILSSCLCLLGCAVIFIDDLYRALLPRKLTDAYPFELKENYRFLVASLGFSSGSLLFTSLYRLLPHAFGYLKHVIISTRTVNVNLIAGYLGGIVISLGLDRILHLVTSESVVHCSHEGHEHEQEYEYDSEDDVVPYSIDQVHDSHSNQSVHEHQHAHGSEPPQHHSHDHSHSHGHDQHHGQYHTHSHDQSHGHDLEAQIATEESPLIPNQPKKKFSFIHAFGKEPIGECKGYSSAEICVNDTKTLHYCELPTLTKSSTSLHEIHSNFSNNISSFTPEEIGKSNHSIISGKTFESDHHHHVTTPMSRLLMIGIQTTLAITLHKLPEGFITYVTSEANSSLGIEIFLSLLVHNFIEGFSMCLPLYYSFNTTSTKYVAKIKALIIAGGLGGVSQPLGALIGYLFLRYSPTTNDDIEGTLDYIFGISMAVTAGFLTTIGLTMFGSAVSFNNRSVNEVVVWSLLGIGIISGSLLLSGGD